MSIPNNNAYKILFTWTGITTLFYFGRDYLTDVYALGTISSKIPSYHEAHIMSSPYSFTQVIAGDVESKFGQNPTTKTILRDIPKTVGTIVAHIDGTEQGTTGLKYGAGNIAAAVIKPACKLTVIPMVTYYSLHASAGITLQDSFLAMVDISGTLRGNDAPQISFSNGGRVANYICEPLARFFVVVENDRQKSNNTEVAYIDYMVNDFDWKWLLKGPASGLAKAFASDITGEYIIKKLGVGDALKSIIGTPINYFQNGITKYLSGGVNFNFEFKIGNVWSKFKLASTEINGLLYKISTFTSILSFELLGQYMEDISLTFLISPKIRIVASAVDNTIDYLVDTEEKPEDKNDSSLNMDLLEQSQSEAYAQAIDTQPIDQEHIEKTVLEQTTCTEYLDQKEETDTAKQLQEAHAKTMRDEFYYTSDAKDYIIKVLTGQCFIKDNIHHI